VTRIGQCLTDFTPYPSQPSTLSVELSVRPSQLTAAAQSILQLDPQPAIQCHAGDGLIVASFPCDPPQTQPLVDTLRQIAASLQATAVVLHHPPSARLDSDAVWGPRHQAHRAMERIKHEFDPQDILNPTRFIF